MKADATHLPYPPDLPFLQGIGKRLLRMAHASALEKSTGRRTA